jgi:type III restriction enzyme
MSFEVGEPIQNNPFEEPQRYWYIQEGATPQLLEGRRPAMVFQPRDQREDWPIEDGVLRRLPNYERAFELLLVSLVRERIGAWRAQGYPGATRTTLDLLAHWRRDGRHQRLFFAQLEAAESVIFLKEARSDFLQGIDVPREALSEDAVTNGYRGFERLACKMATGSGKTTVMAMLAAWSILNKVNNRADGRFSDAVLIIAPNVTIRDRLRELDPEAGDASVYRTRDLVPAHLMPLLVRGRVLVRNWHVLQPQAPQSSGGSRVVRTGVRVETTETLIVGEKTTTARGSRYVTRAVLDAMTASGELEVLEVVDRGDDDEPKKVRVRSIRWQESDSALVKRVMGREFGGKQNILVMNDEAHHAYRILRTDDDEGDEEEEEEFADFVREATVWVEGLDRIQKERGINFCVDLSATPYYLGRVGQATGKPFPWVISDFGLIDAIESGLVKVPQLAVRDTTGDDRAKYFNIWRWITGLLTAAERGTRRGSPKPEAVLKYATTPILMMGADHEEMVHDWSGNADDPRPPVFILVCKNTKIAATVYDWLAEGKAPAGIPESRLEQVRNRPDRKVTIRIDSKVVAETDSGHADSDREQWMRFTLDTVGKVRWPSDSQGRPMYPEGFEQVATKLERPLHPPGRDVRCIVSVGMLTEGWDANTVTHIIGIRPFMSQLLCEQVVGRGLRRASYEINEETGHFREEVAQVLGVPFEIVPFKASAGVARPPAVKRWHVQALPEREQLEIKFPRVEGYTQAIRHRIRVDWSTVAPIRLDPLKIPPEAETRGLSLNTQGRPTITGPGRVSELTLKSYRADRRLQEAVFSMARDITRAYVANAQTKAPAHVLFPQIRVIVDRYVREKVEVVGPEFEIIDALLVSPYYGHVLERITQAIHPDSATGESHEVPRYERGREFGSTTDVDWWTSKDVQETTKSHLNYMVADTRQWEQSAAYRIDHHKAVRTWVKNAGLGFTIPYVHNGQSHDYHPDFIVQFDGRPGAFLIIETKGYDELMEVKRAAAERWCKAVNADGKYGTWRYGLATNPGDVPYLLNEGL